MKRRYLLGATIAALATLALPATALAQLPPSPPVMFVFGKATGASIGQGVIAIVSDGTTSATCGASTVVADGSSNPAFAIDILSDSQIRGCGLSGRTVRFYFTPTGVNNGRMATESVTIPGTFQAKSQDLTLGAPLTQRRFGVQVASDKTN